MAVENVNNLRCIVIAKIECKMECKRNEMKYDLRVLEIYETLFTKNDRLIINKYKHNI